MPRGQRVKSKSGYYHVMVRGNEKKNVFLDDEDKQRFMEILSEKKNGERFFLQAFCLMNNHIHLVLNEGTEDVASVMKSLGVTYVHFFNKKYERVGHLFQDRFKSEVVEKESYFLCLVRYVHQNPVKAGIVQKVTDYKWSSYNCYLDSGNCFPVVDTATVLGLFSEDRETAVQKFEQFMNEKTKDTFIDIDDVAMDEKAARELYGRMLLEQSCVNSQENTGPSEGLIREFKEKTNLSTRRIAAITGYNKDKVSKILRK